MKFWFDTEFIESGYTQPIEFISIGMVAEDGREYYACNQDLDFDRLFLNPWLVENVLPHLPVEKRFVDKPWTPGNVLLSPRPENTWKKRPTIARELIEFCGEGPELWSYYADYDWVVLCQLFGSMISLPPTWPMFCRDVKQLADSKGGMLPKQDGNEHHALADARHHRVMYEFLEGPVLRSSGA